MYKNYNLIKYIFNILVLVCFLGTSTLPASFAQEVTLPIPGTILHLSPNFNPAMLKGIKVYPDNPLRFDFIIDFGDMGRSNEQDASRLIKYFLASLTTPEQDMWVNLSPYEKNRIVPESFGRTEMGRDLLAQDYILKEITASLIYPQEEFGKTFWARVQQEARKKFGNSNIPINTFNKVWIVPAKALIFENPQTSSAYIINSKLQVLLEEDYTALNFAIASKNEQPQNQENKTPSSIRRDINSIGNQIIREVVIPALTKEVNEGKNFSQLRQIYQSLILAAWYKKKIKNSILSQVYVNQNKVAGININDPNEKQKIYESYLEIFKKGAYNYIKEDIDPLTEETVPQKYYSGGFSSTKLTMDVLATTQNWTEISHLDPIGNGKILQVKLASASTDVSPPNPSLPKPPLGRLDWMTTERKRILLNSRSNDEWVAISESEYFLAQLRSSVHFQVNDQDYTLSRFLKTLKLGSDFQTNSIRDGGGSLVIEINETHKVQFLAEVQKAINAFVKALREDDSFDRAYEIKIAEQKKETYPPETTIDLRISFLPRYDTTAFDSRIPVSQLPLNLADPSLRKMTPMGNSSFGEIYFYPDEFEKFGYFYKVVQHPVPNTAIREKNYGHEYEEMLIERGIERAAINEANFILDLNSHDIHTVPTISERGITHDGRTFIKLKGLPKSVNLKDFIENNSYPLLTKVNILRQIAEIYLNIHDTGIVHFDIKPENIIISPQTHELMAIDFGVSRQASRETLDEDIKDFQRLVNFLLGDKDLAIVKGTAEKGQFPWIETQRDMSSIVITLSKIEAEIQFEILMAKQDSRPVTSSAVFSKKNPRQTNRDRVGGIDLKEDKLNIAIKEGPETETSDKGNAVKMELSLEQIREFQAAPGFTPSIINIQPIKNLEIFLKSN